MDHRLKISGKNVEAKVQILEDEKKVLVELDGMHYEWTYRFSFPDCLFLSSDGKSHRIFVVQGRGGTHVFLKGHPLFVKESKRPPRSLGASLRQQPTGAVSPPTPAVVTRILVAEGDRVKKGQALIVVTAMKMETILRAPHAGIIRKIRTELQAKVSPGQILVEITEEERNNG